MADANLTAERLRELLSYDAKTGLFTWRVARRRARTDTPAGTRTEEGYVRIRIDGVRYRAHRLAWLYTHGRWPPNLIDHIDRDPSNNRLANLREATYSENERNKVGGAQHAQGVFRIGSRFKAVLSLGYFESAEEAAAVLEAARSQIS